MARCCGNPTTFRSTSGLTYNADNQRTGITYDGNGNPGSWNGNNSCSYDAENRLISLQGISINDTFVYRADGLRTAKYNHLATSVQNNSVHTNTVQTVTAGLTYYLYDEEMPLLELNSGGGITTTTTWGMGQVLARNTTGGRTLLLVPDAQGNVGQQVNASSGSVVAAYGYDAWGLRVAKGTDTAAKADGFAGYGGTAGYYTDSESGLTLCGHRYYDANTGRWLTRDPIGFAGGVNLYQYCGNSPLVGQDTDGTSLLGLAAIGAGVGCLFSAFGGYLDAITAVHGPGKSTPACSATEAAICETKINCLANLVISVLTTILIPEPVTSGCISGIAGSIVNTIANKYCFNKYDPCDADHSSILCQLAKAVASALIADYIGCLSGGLNQGVDTIATKNGDKTNLGAGVAGGASGIGGLIGLVTNQFCH